MNNPTGPETVAAANALSGERTHATLTYPVTGYAECDAITAILTLLNDIPCRRAQRIGEYIAARFKDAADEQLRNAYFQANMQVGLARQGPNQASPLAQAPAVAGLPYWTSTGVVDEVQRQAIIASQQSEFSNRIEELTAFAKTLPNPLP